MLYGLTLSSAAFNGVNGPTIIGSSGAAEGNADGPGLRILWGRAATWA